jgi:signal transduction histidine kinase
MLTMDTVSNTPRKELPRRLALLTARAGGQPVRHLNRLPQRGGGPLVPPTVSATEENVRAHLATELRRETEAFVSAMSHEVEMLRSQLAQGGVRADCALERIQSLLADLTDRMQSLAREESPPPIREIGLERALESYCQHICDKATFEMSFESQIHESAMDPSVKLVVFRVAQDALDHIVEYRKPTFVSVRLIQEDDDLCLRVEDIGEPHSAPGQRDEGQEMAFLQRLEERIEDCDGQIQVSHGDGFNEVNFQLPVSAPRSACAA